MGRNLSATAISRVLLFVIFSLGTFTLFQYASALTVTPPSGGGGGGGSPTTQPATKRPETAGDKLKKEWDAAKKKCEKDCQPKPKKAAVSAGGNSAPESRPAPSGGSGGGSTPPPPSGDAVKKCIRDCCKKAFKELLAKYSKGKWKLSDSAEDSHPNFDEILDAIIDSLAFAVDNDPKLGEKIEVTYDIKDFKHYNSEKKIYPAAETQSSADGKSHTITYYNPKSDKTGDARDSMPKYAKQTRRYAQFPEDPNMHEHDFIVLTIKHELAHIKYRYVSINEQPGILLEWGVLWQQSLNAPQGSLPGQIYISLETGAPMWAYADNAEDAFAIAMSYYDNGLTFSNLEVWNYVKDFTQYLQ